MFIHKNVILLQIIEEVNYLKKYKYKGEFDNLAKFMADSLYYYGAYSIALELSHLPSKFVIDSYPMDILLTDHDFTVDDISDIIEEMIDSSAISLGLEEYSYYAKELFNKIISNVELYDFMDNINSIFYKNIYHNMKFFDVFPEDIFEKETIYVAAILFNIRDGSSMKWKGFYGGEMWRDIALTISRKGKISNAIFVDNCFDLQHNSGLWLDKVSFPLDYMCHSNTKKILDYRLEGDIISLKKE